MTNTPWAHAGWPSCWCCDVLLPGGRVVQVKSSLLLMSCPHVHGSYIHRAERGTQWHIEQTNTRTNTMIWNALGQWRTILHLGLNAVLCTSVHSYPYTHNTNICALYMYPYQGYYSFAFFTSYSAWNALYCYSFVSNSSTSTSYYSLYRLLHLIQLEPLNRLT